MKIRTFLETVHVLGYIPIAYVCLLCLNLIGDSFSDLVELPSSSLEGLNMPDNIWFRYLLVGILGPLLETVFCQTFPYYFLTLFDFMKRRIWLVILLPAIPFGLIHAFGIRYQLLAFFMGLLFMTTYVLRSKKGDSFSATYLLHAVNNILAITAQHFL